MTLYSDDTTVNMLISESVRRHRLRLGFSQRQVEIALGLSESTFSRYESGQRTISAAMLYRIAILFGIAPATLFPAELVNEQESIELS
jgi:transcriptional regulator with XRE-family HTH domain